MDINKNHETIDEQVIDGVLHKFYKEDEVSESLLLKDLNFDPPQKAEDQNDNGHYFSEVNHKFVLYIQYLKERNEVMKKDKEDSQKCMDDTLKKLVKTSQCLVFEDEQVSDAWY